MHTGSRRSWVVAGAIVVVPVLVVLFGAVWLKWTTYQYEYDIDLCLKNRPLTGHTILIIDATDEFDKDKINYIEGLIEKIKWNLKPFSKFSIFSIDNKFSGLPRNIFSFCNPGTAETTNILVQAPAHVQRKFEEQFERPLELVKQNLKREKASDATPLLEAIRAISELGDFQDDLSERRMIIFSDMLQNSRLLSQYSGDWIDKGAEIISSYPSELRGVKVTVHYLLRNPLLQNDRHREFWQAFFHKRGALYDFFITK